MNYLLKLLWLSRIVCLFFVSWNDDFGKTSKGESVERKIENYSHVIPWKGTKKISRSQDECRCRPQATEAVHTSEIFSLTSFKTEQRSCKLNSQLTSRWLIKVGLWDGKKGNQLKCERSFRRPPAINLTLSVFPPLRTKKKFPFLHAHQVGRFQCSFHFIVPSLPKKKSYPSNSFN